MHARLFASAVFVAMASGLGASCSLDTEGDPVLGSHGGGQGRAGSPAGGAAGVGGAYGTRGSSGSGASGSGTGAGGTAGSAGSGGVGGATGSGSAGTGAGSGGASGAAGGSGSGGAGAAPDSGSPFEIEAGLPPACDACMKLKCSKSYDRCAADPICEGMVSCYVSCVSTGGYGCLTGCASGSMKSDKEGLALFNCSKTACPLKCNGL